MFGCDRPDRRRRAACDPPNFGALAAATVAARVVQTSIHMLLPVSNPMVAARFSFFLIQVLAMIAMGISSSSPP